MNRVLIAAALLAAASSVGTAQSTSSSAQTVTVTLSEWKVELSRDTVRAGSITLRTTNAGGMNHAIYVRGEGVEQGMREVSAKQSGSLTIKVKPGKYEVFCPMAEMSHKAAGMTSTLVVIPADPPSPPKKPGT